MHSRALSSLAAIGLTVLGFVTDARADLVVTQQVEGGGLTGEMTIKIKGGHARADLAQPISLLIDADAGETIYLRHTSRTFTRVTAQESAGLTRRVEKEMKSGAAPHLEATSQRKQIGGRQTMLYVWSIGAMKMRFWVAPGYPEAARIQQQLDVFQRGGLAGVAAELMPKPESLPGVRLCTEVEFRGQKVTYTITSIREEAVPAETFAIPRGYHEGPGADPAGSPSP